MATEVSACTAEMDHGIMRLIQTHPQDILDLALPGATYMGTLPTDVATEAQLMLDTLLRVSYLGVCTMRSGYRGRGASDTRHGAAAL